MITAERGTKGKNRTLLKALARARLTYQQAASLAGIDRSTVIRAVNGDPIRYQTAVQISDVFQLTPEDPDLA